VITRVAGAAIRARGTLAIALGLALASCANAPAPAAPSSAAPVSSTDDALARVAAIHGGAGPWAVAGYRMGAYALARLGLERQSFDLEVVHHTPREVQFSCIADGASAATGASAGKLNLTLVDAPESGVETTYRRKSTGQSITLRPSAAFATRFRDVPREQLAAAGRTVLGLPDAEVFEEVPAPAKP
jgi:formylmethanofuran dehydrogenase subunit E